MRKAVCLIVAFAAGALSFPWLYVCSDWLLAVRRERQATLARYGLARGGRMT
jgi:hypothetical protein